MGYFEGLLTPPVSRKGLGEETDLKLPEREEWKRMDTLSPLLPERSAQELSVHLPQQEGKIPLPTPPSFHSKSQSTPIWEGRRELAEEISDEVMFDAFCRASLITGYGKEGRL